MNRGFTLFEMLVSLGIFMLLTTTLLVKNSQFKGNVVIGNTAYQLALAFREAQAYGVNVRGVESPSLAGSYIYNTPYGLHFDTSNMSSYVLFGDIYPPAGTSPNMGDRLYTDVIGQKDATVRTYTMPSDTKVVMFCTKRSGAPAPLCGGTGTGSLTTLDVSFLRPQLSAAIRDSSQMGTVSTTEKSLLFAVSAVVVVKNAQGVCKAVKVTSAGSVSVVEDPKSIGDVYGELIAPVCP